MARTSRGFTLIEVVVVIVIIGILSAIAIPNYVAMQNRAKVGSVKSNMHTFQMACEDYAVQTFGGYPIMADTVGQNLAGEFQNPFDHSIGKDKAWEDRPDGPSSSASEISGITSYGDSASGVSYSIKGYGPSSELSLVLYAGNQAESGGPAAKTSSGSGGGRRAPDRPDQKKTED